MQAMLSHLFAQASTWPTTWPEPVALLVLGVLMIILSFLRERVRSRPADVDLVSARKMAKTATPLAAHQQ